MDDGSCSTRAGDPSTVSTDGTRTGADRARWATVYVPPVSGTVVVGSPSVDRGYRPVHDVVGPLGVAGSVRGSSTPGSSLRAVMATFVGIEPIAEAPAVGRAGASRTAS